MLVLAMFPKARDSAKRPRKHRSHSIQSILNRTGAKEKRPLQNERKLKECGPDMKIADNATEPVNSEFGQQFCSAGGDEEQQCLQSKPPNQELADSVPKRRRFWIRIWARLGRATISKPSQEHKMEASDFKVADRSSLSNLPGL